MSLCCYFRIFKLGSYKHSFTEYGRENLSRNYADIDPVKRSENKDVADSMVDNNEIFMKLEQLINMAVDHFKIILI